MMETRQIQRVQDRPPRIHRREDFRERLHQGRATLFGDSLAPCRRLADAVADEGHQQRGRAADHEHPAPAVLRADVVVGQRRQEEAEVVAGVHVAGAGFAAVFRPFLGEKRRADEPFAADADAGEHAERASCHRLVAVPHSSVNSE
jgi:hypothetical protein